MKLKTQSEQTKQRLLEAAISIVTTRGVMQLTLDTVAHKAGISKGGLLHHFPSKDALIRGLIEKLIAEFDEQVERELEKEPPGQPGRWLRAYIRANFAPEIQLQDITTVINLSVVSDPEVLRTVRDSFIAIQQLALNDGIDPARATLVRLAADGLSFGELLGIAPVPEPLRGQVFDELMRLTQI